MPRRQLGGDPLAIGGRAFTHVDGDIEDAPADAADQLVLTVGRSLKMQAAEREWGCRERMVILHECANNAECLEGRRRIDLGEPAPRVAEAAGGDEL